MPKIRAVPIMRNPKKRKTRKPAKRRPVKRRKVSRLRRNPPRVSKKRIARLWPWLVCAGSYYWTGDVLDNDKKKAARYYSETVAARVARTIQSRLPRALAGVLARAERA